MTQEVRRVEEYESPVPWFRPGGGPIRAVAEITDEEWAGYSLAADKYYRWIEKLDNLRKRADLSRRGVQR